jgi:hypothetical protein
VTDATKVVIVVHEFGYAFPDIAKKCEQWRSHGLLIIEDCAHLVGLDLPEGRVGSFGDFVLVSLPKILPTTIGGLMLARRKINFPKPTGKQEQDTLIGQAASERFLFHHKHLSSARIARHKILKSMLGIRIWEPTANAIPFASYVKKIDQFREIPDIEFLSTLSESFLLIPTNPFVDTQVFSEIAEVL